MKNKKFTIEYKTEEDVLKDLHNFVENKLKDKEPFPDIKWEGKDLYVMSEGHQYGKGFFIKFVTKEFDVIHSWSDGNWVCDGNIYRYEDGEFKLQESKQRKIFEPEMNRDISELKFPVIKNIKFPTKSFADDIEPVIPIDPDDWDNINLDE